MGDDKSVRPDCLSCRLISLGAGLGIGTYLIYEGQKINGWGKRIYTILGIGFGALGCASFARDKIRKIIDSS